jgi:exonuclease III
MPRGSISNALCTGARSSLKVAPQSQTETKLFAGRVIALVFSKLATVSVFAPQAGNDRGTLRAKVDEWFPKLTSLVNFLQSTETVVVAQDFNFTARDIDTCDPSENKWHMDSLRMNVHRLIVSWQIWVC